MGSWRPPVEPQHVLGGEFNPCKNLPESTMLSPCLEAEEGGDRRGHAGTVASQQTRRPRGPPPGAPADP